MVGPSISVRADFTAVERELKVRVPKVIKQARVSSINKVGTMIKGRAVKGIAKSAGVKPQKIISQRTKLLRANRRRMSALIVVFLNPVPAQAMKARTLKRGGVTAAGRAHKWPKGFGGIFGGGPSAGKPGKWERTGERSYPIRQLTVPIESKAPILRKVGDRVVRSKFRAIFERELAFRLKRYAGTI